MWLIFLLLVEEEANEVAVEKKKKSKKRDRSKKPKKRKHEYVCNVALFHCMLWMIITQDWVVPKSLGWL